MSTTETKLRPTNLKKAIVLGFSKNREVYLKLKDHEKAFAKMLELENFDSDLPWPKGYDKYFYKHVVVNDETSVGGTLHQDFLKYSTEVIKIKPMRGGGTNLMDLTSPLDFEITTFSPSRATVDEKMFASYLTNSEIDEIFSDDFGAMAATSVVVTGGPGVGKSTVLFFMANKYREIHPEAKIAVVSSEMEQEDLLYEARRKPWMNSLEFILTSDYGEHLKHALAKIFNEGFDIIILDSFADICDKLKDFNGMTGSQAELFLLELMKKTKGGKNKTGTYTLNLVIQQVTKGGNFAGSNKLKHNTTAMLELRRESSGDRYMTFTKNRRCGQYVGKKLYYFLGAGNQVNFDTERWEREKAGDEVANEGTDNTNNNLLSQFAEISADSANRMRLLMQQDGLTEEVIAQIQMRKVYNDSSLENITLPNGVSLENITQDENINFYFLEIPGENAPLFGESRSTIIEQLVKKYGPQESEDEELEED